jgi:hypothetical protein
MGRRSCLRLLLEGSDDSFLMTSWYRTWNWGFNGVSWKTNRSMTLGTIRGFIIDIWDLSVCMYVCMYSCYVSVDNHIFPESYHNDYIKYHNLPAREACLQVTIFISHLIFFRDAIYSLLPTRS